MNHTTTSNKAYYAQVIFLALVIGIGLQIAQAWTGPGTGTPPNTSTVITAPVTTGPVTQVKNGDLGLVGNLSAGMVRLNAQVVENASCVNANGTSNDGALARATDGALLNCVSGVWKKSGSTIDTNIIQSRVTGSCTVGQAITAINANGTVSCTSSSGMIPVGGMYVIGYGTFGALGNTVACTGQPGSCIAGYTKTCLYQGAVGGSGTAQSSVTVAPLIVCKKN